MGHMISLADQGTGLTIEVLDYENRHAEHADDASWLEVNITINAAPFSGAFKTTLTMYDLLALYEGTEKMWRSVSGRLTFQSTEGDLTVNIAFSSGGRAHIEIIAQPHGKVKASLQFGFETDQSVLGQTVLELKAATEYYQSKKA